MKIVCDSCGAKYSIADEKVAGRVFKIRCKKCGAAIVVKGDQGAAAEATGASSESGAAGAGFDYGSEAAWHVVVEGEQQGPLTPAQLGAMISAGTIGWDAYVWREGFEDWKPAQDIEDLVQAIMNPGGGGEAAAEAGDPFAEAAPASAPPAAAKPAAKAAVSRDVGADLFAQSDAASPFGGGGGDDDDVVASAPSPRVSANQAAMTGARNENSVLFSLSNLQALATGAPGGAPASSSSSSGSTKSPSTPAPRAGMAAGEGSGLIDIRALAGATGSMGGGGGGGAPARVDDLLSIGAPSPGLGSALAAPVIIPEKKESGSGRGLIIGGAFVGISVLAAAAVIAVVMMNNQPDPATTAAATPPATATAGAIQPGTAPPPTTPVATATATATPVAAGTEAAAGAGTPPPATETATAGSTGSSESSGGGGGGRRRGGGGGGGGGSSASASASAGSSSSGGSGGSAGSSAGAGAGSGSSGSTATRASSGGGSDIDALLEGALSGGGGGSRRGSSGGGGGSSTSGGGGGGGGGGGADSSLPQTPGRDDVIAAMNRVQPAVAACGGGQHGTATVAIVVAGTTGRVTNATVSGQFSGTPVGSCIARAVRGATFPRFQRASFTVNYPFRI